MFSGHMRIFLKIQILLEIASECQTVWTWIRPSDSPGLIWIKAVCKGRKKLQMTLAGKKLNVVYSYGD